MDKRVLATELVKLARRMVGGVALVTTGQYFDSRTFAFNEALLEETKAGVAEAEQSVKDAEKALENAKTFLKDAKNLLDAYEKQSKTLPEKVAKEFAEAAGKQADKKFKVEKGGLLEWTVNLEEWPDGEAFGPWFQQIMDRHGVQVDD